MIKHILSIDPGKSTGATLISVSPNSLPVLEDAWQFSEGVLGFLNWYHTDLKRCRNWQNPEWKNWVNYVPISEKFTARATSGFSYRTDALEPLRVEGAMIALGMMPDYSVAEKRWVDPAAQYIAGGKDKATKKRRQHRMLKDLGYYVTGKDVGCPDADDVRSSLAHSLGYLMRVEKHEPTYRAISDWIEENQ